MLGQEAVAFLVADRLVGNYPQRKFGRATIAARHHWAAELASHHTAVCRVLEVRSLRHDPGLWLIWHLDSPVY